MSAEQFVYVGIRGSVLALHPGDGSIVWQTKLKGSDYVTLSSAGPQLFAITLGEVFCLDAGTGALQWHNPLRGWGTGLATLLVPGGNNTTTNTVAAEMRRQQQAAASAAASATNSASVS